MRHLFYTLGFALLAAPPVLAAESVNVARFKGIQLVAGGQVTVRSGPVHKVTIVEGSSAFTNIAVTREGTLRILACNHRCPANYKLRIEVQSPDVREAAITGGGSITFADGFAGRGDIAAAVSGGGTIDLRAMRSDSVMAAIYGGGLIRSGRPHSLMAAVSGGGEIRYSGDPQVQSAVNGGGSVNRE